MSFQYILKVKLSSGKVAQVMYVTPGILSALNHAETVLKASVEDFQRVYTYWMQDKVLGKRAGVVNLCTEVQS